MGNHASDKAIDIVAIKKTMEDKLVISLLNRSEEKAVEGLLINLKCSTPEDELLGSMSVRGISSYGINSNKDTGYKL
ncbi:hypothetical protein [Sedimentibacter sp.]|uniref:hypothetical protein n=1 Tax=Sedimentibacter sp. TaxID=1960295 RepID=UPI00289830B7|nr:hypothetical protein [Sedimentibacter sp.]